MPANARDATQTAAPVNPSTTEALSQPEFEEVLTALPPGLPDLPPGFETMRYVARGGMGHVIKAKQKSLNRVVAVKMLRAEIAADESFRLRFLREARTAARLRHPNICQIHEVIEHAGVPFIVMDFIEGQNLAEWWKAVKPSARRCAEIVATLARAVAYAHGHGVIHRDLKPSNVMLEGGSGLLVLMDFGLAKETQDARSDMTRSNQVLGTPAYMSPEQAAGHTDQVGPLSDVYSLGVILYELLTGRPPFDGPAGEVIHKVQYLEPDPPRKLVPSLHRDIETVCLKAMAKNPAERYASAEALAADLERFAAGDAVLARPAGAIERFARTVRRHRGAAVFAAAAVLVCGVAAAWSVHSVGKTQHIAQLRQAIESAIPGQIPVAGQIQGLDALCSQLEALDKQEALLARQQVNKALAEAIRRALAQPRLDQPEMESIEGALSILQSRDKQAAVALRGEYQNRLQAWDTVFELVPPYDNLKAVFDEGRVIRSAEGLLGTASPKAVDDWHGLVAAERDLSTADFVAPLVQPTKYEVFGNVQLEARVDGWTSVPVVGLGLHVAPRGYALLVCVREPGTDMPKTGWLRPANRSFAANGDAKQEAHALVEPVKPPANLALAATGQAPARIQIWRAGVLVQERDASLSDLHGQSLCLRLKREGSTITAQVNTFPALTFDDPFLLPAGQNGRFEVALPSPAILTSLKGTRQVLPPTASSLERGDNLFIGGSYQEALAAYDEQAALASGGQLAQETLYKKGLCLLRLSRGAEAVLVFETLGAENGPRWPLLALCQLWLLYLNNKQTTQAEALLRHIGLRTDAAQLVATLPLDLRGGLLGTYQGEAEGAKWLTPDPERVAKLELADKAAVMLQVPWHDRVFLWEGLMKAKEWDGDAAGAEELARKALAGNYPYLRFRFTESLCRLMRLRGAAGEALQMLNSQLFGADGRPQDEGLWLLLTERARIHCALEQWEQAEADLDLLATKKIFQTGDYCYWADAWLLRGFLAERRGDQEAALEAWRKGTVEIWGNCTVESWVDDPNVEPQFWSGMTGLNAVIVASLTGSVSPGHVDLLLAKYGQFGGRLESDFVRRSMLPTPETLGPLFREGRGLAYARDLAFRRLSLSETIYVPICLVIQDTCARVLRKPATPEEDELLWSMVRSTAELYRRGKVGEVQLLQLLMSYKGVTNILGWSGVAPTLPAEPRGPLAYFLSFRLEKLGQTQDALMLLETARQDAPAGSVLQRLADAELARLSKQAQPTK